MKKSKTFRVGVFDSGVGGLTFLNECRQTLQGVTYLYWGDNARAPYGSRSEEEIVGYVREAMRCFRRRRVDAAVIACNTATAAACIKMRQEFSFPVLGMEPAIAPAAREGGSILVLTTPVTARSARLKVLAGRFPDCRIRIYPAEYLAGAIENKLVKGEPFYPGAHLPEGQYTAVVLGCTHYIYCKKEIEAYYSCPVIDGNSGTAKQLAKVLKLPYLGSDNHYMTTIDNPLKGVKFVGKSRKINKNVYFRTFVSQKSEK